MKIKKSQLRQIIKEEYKRLVTERQGMDVAKGAIEDSMKVARTFHDQAEDWKSYGDMEQANMFTKDARDAEHIARFLRAGQPEKALRKWQKLDDVAKMRYQWPKSQSVLAGLGLQ